MNIERKIWTIYGKYQRTGLYKSTSQRLKLREKRKNTLRYNELREEIYNLYWKEEYGIKLLAQRLDLSYSVTRGLLDFLDIPIRKGRNVVTNRLCNFRKEKALLEGKNKTGWNSPEVNRKYKKHNRGVQGFYYNKSMCKYVWLRSTWEYIYAKWLDKIGETWDVELECYTINESLYRPDFFIFDENKNITKIVEIKGYWDSNTNKVKILNEKLEDIDVIVIYNVDKYIEKNSHYHAELARWKKEKKKEEEIHG